MNRKLILGAVIATPILATVCLLVAARSSSHSRGYAFLRGAEVVGQDSFEIDRGASRSLITSTTYAVKGRFEDVIDRIDREMTAGGWRLTFGSTGKFPIRLYSQSAPSSVPRVAAAVGVGASPYSLNTFSAMIRAGKPRVTGGPAGGFPTTVPDSEWTTVKIDDPPRPVNFIDQLVERLHPSTSKRNFVIAAGGASGPTTYRVALGPAAVRVITKKKP